MPGHDIRNEIADPVCRVEPIKNRTMGELQQREPPRQVLPFGSALHAAGYFNILV